MILGDARESRRPPDMKKEKRPEGRGGLAQLGEHLPCKQGVESSNLLVSTAGEPAEPYLENRIPRHRHPRPGKAGGPPERNGKDNENQRRNEREAAGPHARGAAAGVKLERARGGCLGTGSRRKTRQAAKSCGERHMREDPQVSEWGNPCGEDPHIRGGIHSPRRGTRRTETSK